MKKNLKLLATSLAILLIAVACTFDAPTGFAHANESVEDINLGSFYFANFSSNNENKTTFTPMQGNSRMQGNSVKLTFAQSNSDIFNIDTAVNGFLAVTNINNLYVDLWMYFNSSVQFNTTISFSNDVGGLVQWNITATELKTLLRKDYNTTPASNYDTSFYTAEGVAYGWNLLRLPFASALISGNITTDEEGQTKLNLNEFKISREQTDPGSKIYLYNANFYQAQTQITQNKAVQKQAYVHISKKTDLNNFVTGKFYIGERYNLPTFSEVFNAVWVGEDNLLSDEFRNEQYFKIILKQNNSTPQDYYYGNTNSKTSSFIIRDNLYYIDFCVGIKGIFKSIGLVTLNAESYGTGVWFETNSATLKVGEEMLLEFTVHEAFLSSTIEFSVSDPTVLQIVEEDRNKNTVKVKALKKGEANVIIRVTDDRLNAYGTEYEDGIINSNLAIKVTKAEKKVDVVKILLWISFGGIVVYLGYIIIKTIKNANNYQIK